MIDRQFRLARLWSNEQLRLVAPLFDGDVVNVSAGDDIDKAGSLYRDYFSNARSYHITNVGPGSFRGFKARKGEFLLDLAKPAPEELVNRFDVVFNHTTLEHVFDVHRAFATLCRLSRDAVIVVVPFSQVQHESESFGDYWRIAPGGLRRLFADNGLSVVYEAANADINAATYLFFVGSRYPSRWECRLPKYHHINNAADWIGRADNRFVDRIRHKVIHRIRKCFL